MPIFIIATALGSKISGTIFGDTCGSNLKCCHFIVARSARWMTLICNAWLAIDVVRKGRHNWLKPSLVPSFDTILPTFLQSNYLMISKKGMKEKILDFMMQYIGSIDLEDKVYFNGGGNF